MPKIKVDVKKIVDARENGGESTNKLEIAKKTGYPLKTVEYYLHSFSINGLEFTKPLMRNRNGTNWNEMKEYLKSLQK